MRQRPPFEILNELLLRDEMAVDAAELHGSLCAQICVCGDLDPTQWLGNSLGRPVDPERLTKDLGIALHWLFDWTLQGLADPELGFRLLLPTDEEAMAARAGALARWCAGFVSGYGAAVADRELPEDAREFLSDLTEIAQADFDLESGEDEEVAYAELIEYARVGAILIFDTLRGPQPGEARH